MYLVTAVLTEGRSPREVAAAHGVSKTWVYELLARYRAEGAAGLGARSRRPRRSPTKIADRFEDEIVRVRKQLVEAGYDAGAETIRVHLTRRHRGAVPSVATIWRVLKARGFVTAQPHKRPKSSYIRFCADLPNECWQMDVTHVVLAAGTEVEVLNIIDDHSRLCVASVARRVTKSLDVVTAFHEAAAQHGYPASVLSDNGAIFTAEARHGVCVLESELLALGISFKHSRPYHPQTCGKVERFHQTLKKHLAAHRPARSLPALQGQLDKLRRLLQHRPSPPVPRPPHPNSCVQVPDQSQAFQHAPLDHPPLPDPPGQGQRRQRHPPLPKPPLPPRRRPPTRGHTSAGAGGRPRHPGAHHQRPTATPPHPGPQPPLPAPRHQESSMMSRDSCPRCLATSHWWARGDLNPHVLTDTGT